MAKISDLKPTINTGMVNSGIAPKTIQTQPLNYSPSVPQQLQNRTPRETPTYNVDTRGLGQQFVDTSKADWQQAGKEWGQIKQNFKDAISDEYRPAGAFEKTA